MFLSRKFTNTHSTKALRDYFALAESQPTSATLVIYIVIPDVIVFTNDV